MKARIGFGITLAAFACLFSIGRGSPPADTAPALAWYDTLGFPNVRDLPYVRVATGLWHQSGNHPPENGYAEGFLVSEAKDSFTVFLCGIADFKDRFGMLTTRTPLTTVRFTRKTTGPDYEHVDYEVLDFAKVSSEALERVRAEAAAKSPERGLRWGRPLSYRAQIFSFARACSQKGLEETASALLEIADNIPDEQTGKHASLREALQQQMGHAALIKAEEDCADPANSWADLLKVYASFETRFPASSKVGYAREAAAALRKMIAEDASHHPKPIDQMSVEEQVAEYIYQLRDLRHVMWIMHSRYPAMVYSPEEKKEVITPIHHLVDLGNKAVPQLIEALDNKGFTRSMEPRFNGLSEPREMRVSDMAQRILEHLSGKNLYAVRTDSGKLVRGTTRQQAEAWWAEVQGKGQEKQLLEATSAGGDSGLLAARKLVEKYPQDALDAIIAGIRVTPSEGRRGEFVEIAGLIPGDGPLPFLKSKLDPQNGLLSQIYAAKALFTRGQPEAVPAMIAAWKRLQPRFASHDENVFFSAGRLITFLAKTGDAKAIDALGVYGQSPPIDVRLALVKVFLPFPKQGGGFSVGISVSVEADLEKLPGGEAGQAIERLLASALSDTEQRFGMDWTYNQVSSADPRVCDMAALVLSSRWPEKYPFRWAASSAERDPQILAMQNRWRFENGLPPLAPPARPALPTAPETDVKPWLDKFSVAASGAERDALAAKITQTFGAAALPATRARLETSKDEAFRPLAISLASCIREIQVEPASAESVQKIATDLLKGRSLNGELLFKLANELESSMPPDILATTVLIERGGNSAGFKVLIQCNAGSVTAQSGWSREMVVRAGDKKFCDDNSYLAAHAMPQNLIYRKIANAFEKAIQTDIEEPVVARIRIQRSGQPHLD